MADVVVAGGGTGGPVAAIAAARNGMNTILVERYGYLGGMFTGGNMIASSVRPWAGIPKEIFDRLFEMGAARMHADDPPNYPIYHHKAGVARLVTYDPEMAMIVLFEMCTEAGVQFLLHSYVSGVVTDDDTMKGIIVENKSGRQAIMGKIVCDGTGDGDVAAWAGAKFMKGTGPEKILDSMTLMTRLSHVNWDKVTGYSKIDPGWDKALERAKAKGDYPYYYKPRPIEYLSHMGHPRPELARTCYEDGALLWGGCVEDVDGLDADDLSHAEAEVRRQLKAELHFLQKYIPGFEHVRVENSGDVIGVRDTRHIIGEYVYTGYDYLEEREFLDTVAYNMTGYLDVPYRCLVPKKVDNLLIASRCYSVEPGNALCGPTLGAFDNMKSMVSVMSYGQAAGTAAALCVKTDCTPRALDVKALQATLIEQGALVEPEVIAELKSQKTGSGITIGERLTRRRKDAKQRWIRMGYTFSR